MVDSAGCQYDSATCNGKESIAEEPHQRVVRVRQQNRLGGMPFGRCLFCRFDQGTRHSAMLRQVYWSRQKVRERLLGSTRNGPDWMQSWAGNQTAAQEEKPQAMQESLTTHDDSAHLQTGVPPGRRLWAVTGTAGTLALGVTHLHVVLESRVVGRGDQDAVTWIRQELEHVVQDGAAAGLHDEVLRAHLQTLCHTRTSFEPSARRHRRSRVAHRNRSGQHTSQLQSDLAAIDACAIQKADK